MPQPFFSSNHFTLPDIFIRTQHLLSLILAHVTILKREQFSVINIVFTFFPQCLSSKKVSYLLVS